MHTLGPCGSLQQPLLRGWESLLLPPQPPGALLIRGLRLYFLELEPWVARSTSLPAVRPVYLCSNVGLQCATRTLPALLSATPSPALLVYLRECVAAGSASAQTACALRPTLCQSLSRHSHVSPLHLGASPPLLPVWMNVYFLFPWCRTPLPFDSLSVLVVRGGAVCLPMPPSWLSTGFFLLSTLGLNYTERVT